MSRDATTAKLRDRRKRNQAGTYASTLPLPDPSATALAQCTLCTGWYTTDGAGHRAHVAVFGHGPRDGTEPATDESWPDEPPVQ